MLRYVCRKTLRPVCLANLSAVCRCCAFFPPLTLQKFTSLFFWRTKADTRTLCYFPSFLWLSAFFLQLLQLQLFHVTSTDQPRMKVRSTCKDTPKTQLEYMRGSRAQQLDLFLFLLFPLRTFFFLLCVYSNSS